MSEADILTMPVDRRRMTQLMALVPGGLALSPMLGATAAHAALPFAGSADELRAFMKLQSRTDTGYTNYFNAGTVYAAIGGSTSVPMYKYEGLLRFHTRVLGPDLYEVTFIEGGTYLDHKTGQKIDRFLNPVTGKTVAVEHIVEGPMSWRWTPESLQVKNPIPILSRRVAWQHFVGQSWLHFDNIISAGAAAGPMGHAAALVTYSGSTAQLNDKARTRVDDTVLMDSSINPWSPWLQMGDAPGRLANNIIGRKLGALSGAPKRLLQYLGGKHPKVLGNVETWA